MTNISSGIKVNSIKLKGDYFTLKRESDGVGDEGRMLVSIDFRKDQFYENEVRVGCRVKCGSFHARTMQWQDWWMTSEVEEILAKSDQDNWVQFRTKNSVYTLGSR